MMNSQTASRTSEMPCLHRNFLEQFKTIIRHSHNAHEQTAYNLVCELEELADTQMLAQNELALIVGKAADILTYFKYDFESLARESTWYRACVIHQMSCGMLQTIAMLRPDLNTNGAFGESAHYLYHYRPSYETAPDRAPLPGPLKCKYW